MPLSHLLISKKRIINFQLTISIEDIINVPLVSGLYYVKWKIRNASSGSTMRAPIRDHSIYWGSTIDTDLDLVISKQHVLGACGLKLEVYQELGKETTLIGDLTINLSEYATVASTRRYLLEHCKFNSTIKLSINIKQNSNQSIPFDIPPLKKQQIFTDIPTLFHEKNQDKLDRISLHSAHTNSMSSSPLLPRKSQSTLSLPLYYDSPSPTDLVEQLFKQKTIK